MSYQELTPQELLGHLNDVEEKFAPERLFVSGNTGFLKTGARVAIVGSRKASDAGLARARKLARLLTEQGAAVVSGLAEGIDAAAHLSAIEAGGRTIAVLGTPLDRVYPKKHAKLQGRIMEEHLCVSQFPSGYPTSPGCFPRRNRTMALLSDATVIIEAENTSGTISQGWEALRLGRGLFLTRTIVEDPSLTGLHELLEYGAKVLSDETLEDFFAALPPRTQVELGGAVLF